MALSTERVEELVTLEWERYAKDRPRSRAAWERARRTLPLGVCSSFQHFDPHPITIAAAAGAWATDVDGRSMLDLNMGFGSLLVGHLHPHVVDAVERQLKTGTLYVAPDELAADLAEQLAARFGLEKWRFVNSGSAATSDAIRVARAATKRDRIVKVEGGYHGHGDALMFSTKPNLAAAGDARTPATVPASAGIPALVAELVAVVPFNDAEALYERLRGGDVAAFIVEPVMENIGICNPDPGYLEKVRSICDEFGTLLVFDEVKTGLTYGPGGATRALGVQPDLVTLAKSIGGGFPLAAFGGSSEVMATIERGDVAHFGTYNGNPLVLAAAKATLELCTPSAIAAAAAISETAAERIRCAAGTHGIEVQVPTAGVKGSVFFATAPVRNYRDYKARTDFALAELSWLWGTNRDVLTPPGLDEQWLVSLAHREADMRWYTDALESLFAALTA